VASFRKRGSSWEYRIKYTDPVTGKKREKTKAGFKTKKKHRLKLQRLRNNSI
jgi:Arm DNA-binding domain